jgi:glucokinase
MNYLGIDLGGTNIAVGVVNGEGKILGRGTLPTGVGRPAEVIFADMARACLLALESAGMTLGDIEAVGIGSPGLINNEEGEIVFANNLYWHNVRFREELQKHIDKPVYADNDANVAALAECAAGGMKGARNAILLTLGTGVGGGIILDGKVFGGYHHGGAELGHICLILDGEPCTCGNRGCVERYTSATALIREGRLAAQSNPQGLIYKQCGGDLEKITARDVIDSAREGDEDALRIFDDYINALSMTIISIINIFDPQAIALGGGVAAASDFLMEPLRKSVAERLFYKSLPPAKLVFAELGNDAGIIGAAMYAKSFR